MPQPRCAQFAEEPVDSQRVWNEPSRRQMGPRPTNPKHNQRCLAQPNDSRPGDTAQQELGSTEQDAPQQDGIRPQWASDEACVPEVAKASQLGGRTAVENQHVRIVLADTPRIPADRQMRAELRMAHCQPFGLPRMLDDT